MWRGIFTEKECCWTGVATLQTHHLFPSLPQLVKPLKLYQGKVLNRLIFSLIRLIVELTDGSVVLTVLKACLGCGKNECLEGRGSAPSVDLKAWKFGSGWGSCLESVQRGLRARLIPLSSYQTSSWLVQDLAGLLWDGITAAVCVPRLPRSRCVSSWHRGPTHTDSTPLLTDTTDKLRGERTCTQGTGAENLLMRATGIHAGTNDG